jgi:hypothetical protein
MDRSRALPRLLIAGALLFCVAADRPRLPIRESRWLQSSDIVRDLTSFPAECLAWPSDKGKRRAVAVGRILFRSPLLLGGQAARAGLSCASCHRNGRSNPHFHFPRISGEPGTADVTASLMSKKRGDGTFNPKPIPGLAGDPSKLKVSRDPSRDDLRRFIHGLIVEEFDGPEPSAAALNSVTSYVRAMSGEACPRLAEVAITLNAMLADVDSAVRLAAQAYASGDAATGRSLLAAARSMLGSIDERFQLTGLEGARGQLRAADSELFRLQSAETADLSRWDRDWPRRKRALRSAEHRSLFNPAVLRRLAAAF